MKKYLRTLSLSLLASSLLFSATPIFAQKLDNPSIHAFDNKVIKKIDVENIYGNVAYFANSIGARVAGTENEKKTVDYIAAQFKQFGYDQVEIQPFEFIQGYKAPTKTTFTVDGQAFDVGAFGYSSNTQGDITGELVYIGLGKLEDVEGKDLTGKIALIKRGDIAFTEKVKNAKEAGAVGVVIFNNTSAPFNSSLGASETNLPTVSMSGTLGEELVNILENGSLSATLTIEGAEIMKGTSHNVIATKKPHPKHDTGQVIILGAHHDSVAVGTGASDNASGTAVLLEAARVLANTQTDTEIRFITFGAEERGLLGSRFYAQNMSDEDIERTVGMFNMDMVGSKNSGEKLVMFTYDGKENTVTTLGNSAGSRLHEPVPFNQVGRSDHQPFTEVGIDAAVFSYAPLEPEYHSPGDVLELISKDKLLMTAEVIIASIYHAARPDTPALQRAKVAPVLIPAEKDEDVKL
ncbi:M20/M25/M40 family metallo-hydrolase [Ammoniphilus sp. CFH 90114]|uniref:M20/M25/M40 family metallo-hydrolase n=1 Tax=Ammoniphilus sp. CFH 90114 TaxID=2493665 RepID=UPI00100E3BBC|nr:M20/M25/M40 family metallo-hydrolase [Ammoniphilus sp. CFH 90114]RXT03628.1 M28 family peptidase [Ammoniphilus sp. CFH 90114]